jgi:hypothetical protein
MMRKTATDRKSLRPFRHPAVWTAALAAALASTVPSSAGQATLSSIANQGYLFLHPLFDVNPWKATLERLDLVLPDTLASITVKLFGVSRGSDNAVAVFSDASGNLFVMPVLYEKLMAPCYDHALTFDAPRKVTLPGMSLTSGASLHVVRDSLYSSDSVRIAAIMSATPLRLIIATVRASTAAVTGIDTIEFAERRSDQRITGVFGATDSATRQDIGLWVTGTNGLARYLPYANHRFGREAIRDLPEATVAVTHTNGSFAVTGQGRIFRKNPADTFFTFAVAASGALRRVYPQGAIGDNGLFKEFANNTWRADRTLGSGSLRYANFIRRPGGFGVELLDSTWAYSVYTYRDSSTRIAAASPASLSTNINGLPVLFSGAASQEITVMLDDPDSNFSDYTLTHVSGATSVDLKNDGKYAIAPLSDSADCHIGSIKMISGRLTLSLTGSQITVKHECGLGALDPTCQACYWKKYDFQLVRAWRSFDTIKIRTGQHLLRIVNNAQVTLTPKRPESSSSSAFTVRFAAGREYRFRLPDRTGIRPVLLTLHDLRGRTMAAIPIGRGQQSQTLPRITGHGVLVLSCHLSDNTVLSARVPVVKK